MSTISYLCIFMLLIVSTSQQGLLAKHPIPLPTPPSPPAAGSLNPVSSASETPQEIVIKDQTPMIDEVDVLGKPISILLDNGTFLDLNEIQQEILQERMNNSDDDFYIDPSLADDDVRDYFDTTLVSYLDVSEDSWASSSDASNGETSPHLMQYKMDYFISPGEFEDMTTNFFYDMDISRPIMDRIDVSYDRIGDTMVDSMAGPFFTTTRYSSRAKPSHSHRLDEFNLDKLDRDQMDRDQLDQLERLERLDQSGQLGQSARWDRLNRLDRLNLKRPIDDEHEQEFDDEHEQEFDDVHEHGIDDEHEHDFDDENEQNLDDENEQDFDNTLSPATVRSTHQRPMQYTEKSRCINNICLNQSETTIIGRPNQMPRHNPYNNQQFLGIQSQQMPSRTIINQPFVGKTIIKNHPSKGTVVKRIQSDGKVVIDRNNINPLSRLPSPSGYNRRPGFLNGSVLENSFLYGPNNGLGGLV